MKSKHETKPLNIDKVAGHPVRHHIKCPCGKSDGADDPVVHREIYSISYNGEDLVLLETKVCDVCYNKYKILRHYTLRYDESADDLD